MKKLLLAVALLGLVGCNGNLTQTYEIKSASNEGYYGTEKNGDGIAIDKDDVKKGLKVGDKIKITFTREQYRNMEGFEKVEIVK